MQKTAQLTIRSEAFCPENCQQHHPPGCISCRGGSNHGSRAEGTGSPWRRPWKHRRAERLLQRQFLPAV